MIIKALILSLTTSAVFAASDPRTIEWPEELTDSIHASQWQGFENKTTRWSTYRAPSFDWVFIPKSERHLSIGLNFFSDCNLTWLASAGGHGYSATLDTVQNAVMINMEEFRYAQMNPDDTVTVGGGATFQDLVVVVGSTGRELTIGSCPCVGATGAWLGGGVGRLQGKHGLTSDAVKKVRMTLWNGTTVEASPYVNPDLFWGVRGGGQNFGVIMETTLETFPQSNCGLHFSADMIFNGSSLESVIEIMNSLLPVDPALSLLSLLVIDAKLQQAILTMNLVYAGPQEEGERYANKFAPFANSCKKSMVRWVDLNYAAGGGAVAVTCEKGQSHNLYGSIVKSLSPTTMRQLFDSFSSFAATNPALVNSTVLIELFGMDGVRKYPANFSAFPHRGSLNYFVEFGMAYTDDIVAGAADAWARGWRNTFSSPDVSGYDPMIQYQNYAHGDEPLSALYGTERWRQERLSSLKQSYDPHGFFDGYHAIPRSLDGWT